MDTLHLTKTNGDSYEVEASEYGHYIHDHYQQLEFAWTPKFISYRRQHVTATLANTLKAGMDDISCAVVDHMEDMYDLLPMSDHILVQKDAALTAEDQQRLQLWHQKAANNELPAYFFTKPITPAFQAEYINKYGLYDSKTQVLDYINGKDIIDGGAYIGDTVLLFHTLFPQSRICAIEPSSSNIKYMKERVLDDLLQTNSQPNIFIKHAAIGEHRDRMVLNRPAGFATYSVVLTADDCPNYLKLRNENYYPDSEEVDVIPIDELVCEQQLQVGLIKLDIEGFEPQAIRGALHTIKTQRPVIVCAIYHTPEEYYELKPYLESLDLGYDFKLRFSGSRHPYYEVVLIATPQQLR